MHTFCGGMVKQDHYCEQTGPFACTVFPRHFLSTGRTSKPFPAFVLTCLFYCQGAFAAISNTRGAFWGAFVFSVPRRERLQRGAIPPKEGGAVD